MRGLVRHLRATGQLTAGLILRALLSANLELFDCALCGAVGAAASPGFRPAHDRGGASLNALLTRARPAAVDISGVPRWKRAMKSVSLERSTRRRDCAAPRSSAC